MNLFADDVRQPYVIKRGEKVMTVTNMPKFTSSKPVTNSFLYVDGEYISSPYVVSVSNLMVLVNGVMVDNLEPFVHTRESYQVAMRMGQRAGSTTPENVGQRVDERAERFVERLQMGRTLMFYSGGKSNSGMDDGSGALTRIELARKAMQGDEQAKQELIKEMGLENSLSEVRSDWIERLASNTNLETRATRILETKRDRERQEQERRNQLNP